MTIAGGGVGGFHDGDGHHALFHSPSGLALNQEGDVLYVADCSNHRIRQCEIMRQRPIRIQQRNQEDEDQEEQARHPPLAPHPQQEQDEENEIGLSFLPVA